MLKRIVSVILSLVLLVSACGYLPTMEAEAAYAKSTSAKDILKGLDSLRKKFPDGKYWNKMGKKNDGNSWTNNPCPDGHYLNGKQQCIGQCDGFAHKLGTDLFGKNAYNWKTVKFDMDTLCVGDIIRYGNRHTIFVVGFAPKEDGGIIIADCNWDYHCGISWDRYFDCERYLGNNGSNVNWVRRYTGNSFNRDTYLNLPLDSIEFDYSDYVAPMNQWVEINFKTSPSLPFAPEVTWTSSNPEVATVNYYGYIQTEKPGTATITAACNGASASCTVTVTDPMYITRLSGKTRIETAIQISNRFYGWDDSSVENVILANGFNFADALAGVPLSKALDAPILLTGGKNLEDSIKNQLQYLNTKNVYILGGGAAVSNDIEKKLKDSGYDVERLSGISRYETAVVIAEKLAELKGVPTELFLANGASFADALSVGPVAAAGGSPLLYVPSSGELDYTTGEFIASCNTQNVVVLGGTGAVIEDVGHSLSTYGVVEFQRVSGKNRYATCLEIIKKYSDRFGSGYTLTLATGKAFPDALAGGAFAASIDAPLLLTDKNISADAKEWVSGQNFEQLYIFGGTAAVTDHTAYQYTI